MLLQPRYVTRFRQVATVLVRHGFSDVLAQLDLNRFLPGKERTTTTPVERQHSRARHLRLALTELGPAYVKLGQILSTRPDILPAAYLEELEHLQDRVAPFPFEEFTEALEHELGRPTTEVFQSLDSEPLASASLSQVHRGVLVEGLLANAPREVAVKVLRPGVERSVELELDLMTELAELVERSDAGRRYDVLGLVEQLRSTLREELILRQEGRNAEHFAEALREFERIRVPRMVPELTTRRVLTMELMEGTRISEVAPGSIPPGIAEELWRAYLKQVLVDGLFHCDPHPGNFLLDSEGRIAILDFGMVATLTRETQIRLLSILLWAVDADGERAAEACLEFGIAGPDFDERRFKTEVGMLVARYAGRGLGDLALGNVLNELVRTALRFEIRIPTELLLFGKTVLNLEGLCRRLDPALDPVATVREMSASLLATQLGREFSRQKALAATLEARSLMTEVPTNLRRVLRRIATNELSIGIKVEGEAEIQTAIQRIASRITLGLITAALIVGSALLLNVEAGLIVWGYPLFALIGFLLAAGLGLYLVLKIIIADRE